MQLVSPVVGFRQLEGAKMEGLAKGGVGQGTTIASVAPSSVVDAHYSFYHLEAVAGVHHSQWKTFPCFFFVMIRMCFQQWKSTLPWWTQSWTPPQGSPTWQWPHWKQWNTLETPTRPGSGQETTIKKKKICHHHPLGYPGDTDNYEGLFLGRVAAILTSHTTILPTTVKIKFTEHDRLLNSNWLETDEKAGETSWHHLCRASLPTGQRSASSTTWRQLSSRPSSCKTLRN